MATWKKTAPELRARFDAALPAAGNLQRREMFGCPCGFVNGQMFAGMPEDRLIVRVPEEASKHPCVLKGRTMKEYAMIADTAGLQPEAMARWIARGYAFALTLPPKPAQAAPGKVKRAARAA